MSAPATPLVITGIGVASALGLGRQAHWEALTAGTSAVAAWPRDPADPLPVHGGTRVEGFNVAPYLADRKMARLLSRSSALGFAAAHMALADRGLALDGIPGERRGLFCQTGMFQVESRDLAPIVEHCCEDGALSLAKFGEKGMSVINPFLPIKTLPNMGLGALSIAFDMQGPNLVAGPFSAQGAMLLGLAATALQDGDADVCLVVGGDAPFNMMTLSSLLAMDVLDTRELPHLGLFDPANNGLLLGEGGVALVLEREADAVARGATIYARLTGWAMAGGDQVRHGAPADASASQHVLGQVGAAEAVVVEGNGMPAVDGLEQGLFAGKPQAGSKPQVGDWIGASVLLDTAHAALALKTGQWLAARSIVVHGLDLSGTASAVRLEAI